MNTILLTGLPKRGGGKVGKGETHTVLMATRLVMKHIVPKPHYEYGIIPERFFRAGNESLRSILLKHKKTS